MARTHIMSLFDLITRLQNKPPKTRDRIAFGTAGIITLVITLGWVGSFIGRNSSRTVVDEGVDTSPFASLFATVKEGVSGIETYTSDISGVIQRAAEEAALHATTSSEIPSVQDNSSSTSPRPSAVRTLEIEP